MLFIISGIKSKKRVKPMRNKYAIIVCFLVLCLSGRAQQNETIKQFELDEYTIRKIFVHFDKGVTTFMFPTALTGIYGSNVTANTEQQGDFLLSYAPGNYYFSVRALKKNAEGSLNVIYNRKTYVLHLRQDDKESPAGSVTFFTGKGTGGRSSPKTVPPSILLSVLDKARTYHLLKKYYPDNIQDILYVRTDQKTIYDKFNILADEIFRFDKYDTLVFKIVINNYSEEVITYDPRMLAARVGDNVYYASITDASGIIPPKASIPAYFAITGTPTGGRNNLNPNNNWNILLSPDEKSPVSEKAVPQATPNPDAELNSLYKELENNPNLEKLDEIQKKITTIIEKNKGEGVAQ